MIELRLCGLALLSLATACGGSASDLARAQTDDGTQRAGGIDGGDPAAGSAETRDPSGMNIGPDASGGEVPSQQPPPAAEPTPPSADDAGVAAPSGDPIPLVLDGEPAHHHYVRLTHEQWENSIRDNLRLEAPTGWLAELTPDTSPRKYSNDEARLEVGPTLYSDYERAAEALSRTLAADSARLETLYRGSDARGFITEVGRRFYRRPLTEAELSRFEHIFATGSELASAPDEFSGGVSLVLEVLLQAPHFLYRIESTPDGEPLSGYEVATRLAYFITNSTPSDALLERAEDGTLNTAEGVRAAAEALLDTPRASAQMRRFHGETFSFDAFATLALDPASNLEPSLNQDLEEAAYSFFDRIFEGSFGLREVLLTDAAFATDSMAMLYGLDHPTGTGAAQLTLGPERPGFFTQLPFLMLHSFNGTRPDSVARGVVINDDVLCAALPPAADESSPPPERADATNRSIISDETAAPECASCHHAYLNPLGFAFENFDGLGRQRAVDNGIPVQTDGSYPFIEGTLDFAGAPELMALLAESEQAHACFARHITEFGLARSLSPEDRPLVNTLAAASRVEDASLRDIILRLVTSPEFRTRRGNL